MIFYKSWDILAEIQCIFFFCLKKCMQNKDQRSNFDIDKTKFFVSLTLPSHACFFVFYSKFILIPVTKLVNMEIFLRLSWHCGSG